MDNNKKKSRIYCGQLVSYKNPNRTQLSSPTSHCRHLLHLKAGRCLPFPATSRGTHKQVSGVHPLPGRLLPLRWLTSCYDSFSKGTIVPRDHNIFASVTLWLIKSEPCMAGGATHLADTGVSLLVGHPYRASHSTLPALRSTPASARFSAGRHPRPFLALSPASGHGAFLAKATSLDVFCRWMSCLQLELSTYFTR